MTDCSLSGAASSSSSPIDPSSSIPSSSSSSCSESDSSTSSYECGVCYEPMIGSHAPMSLCCSHTLCATCCIQLRSPFCPFCHTRLTIVPQPNRAANELIHSLCSLSSPHASFPDPVYMKESQWTYAKPITPSRVVTPSVGTALSILFPHLHTTSSSTLSSSSSLSSGRPSVSSSASYAVDCPYVLRWIAKKYHCVWNRDIHKWCCPSAEVKKNVEIAIRQALANNSSSSSSSSRNTSVKRKESRKITCKTKRLAKKTTFRMKSKA